MFAIKVGPGPTEGPLRTVRQANIYLNGSLKYKSRSILSYESDVVDLDGEPIIRCRSFSANWWRALFGCRAYIIQAEDGPELARIIRHGLFGENCDISIDGQTFSCPSRGELSLPSANFAFCDYPIEVRANASDDSHKLAYIGIAVHLWLWKWGNRSNE
jgi:hypothetical protein